MSPCHRGFDAKLKDTEVTIGVSSTDTLATLANAIEWRRIAALAIPDLKHTTKGYWYLGRRMSLRSHLAVMILRTPVLQVFCGRGLLPDWRCPDHMKIEELKNRLSPDTHKATATN